MNIYCNKFVSEKEDIAVIELVFCEKGHIHIEITLTYREVLELRNKLTFELEKKVNHE